MDIIRGIEGDYIETKDNLFFDVKGLLHPKDRKICFIRFYPHSEGDRIKNGRKYKKIYDLKERYLFLRENYPKYLFFSEELDSELQGVKDEDIKKIYTPREYFKSLFNKSNLSQIEKSSKELCELFIQEGLPDNSIGITGSSMVGLSKDDSDIDLIIYGTDVSLKFQEKLEQIINECDNCRKYNLQEFVSHYEWRAGGSDVPFDNFMQCEQRKLHQGIFKGFEFFIRFIKSPEDWHVSFFDYKYKNCGRIKLKALIIDDKNSIFTPCSYKINVIKIIESDIPSNRMNLNYISEVNSFRGRFCEHAKKGEKILVEGKLEEIFIEGKNKKKYYRILLSDQVKDKMLLLGK
ncbi:MAG: nucleotidyltransferase domain-containing protein [Promethearchaeota archaeon]